jgi:adenine-specific DNA-methyltransferase
MRTPKGALELTWTDKDLALLSHGETSYEWVEPTDYRVSEVRLLHITGSVGRPRDNLLIQGDAMHALSSLTNLPEYAKRYVGKVKLCFVDPPFNTGQVFEHYEDNLENSVWLTLFRDRMVQIRELLADDGSLWVHLDDAQVHRARCVLDEVFGADKYVNTIIWGYKTYQGAVKDFFPRKHDTILWYNKDKRPGFTLPYKDNVEETVGFARWRAYLNDQYQITGGNFPATDSRFMAYHRRWVKDNGRQPGPDDVILQLTGEVVTDVWTDIPAIDPKDKVNKNGYSTQKPEPLIERILAAATEPGDLVLDCFAGSGTTAAVAHKMGRRWVTVELSPDNVEDYVLPRLSAVVAGTDPSGITAAYDWRGGGGFTVAQVGPSMFETTDSGRVVLAEWVTGGDLAQAVAAQVGYDFAPDGPFAGRQGRSRLAVIDGVLGLDVATYLVGQLGDDETLLAVAQAVEPGVAEQVRQMRRGSRVRNVPRDLAHVGKGPSRIVTLPTPSAPATDGHVTDDLTEVAVS